MLSKHLIASVALGALLALPVRAQDTTVAGIVTTVDANTIQVRTDRQEIVLVTVTSNTKFQKWIMGKPLQQDPRGDLRMIRPGMRVRLKLAPTLRSTADTVWIVVGRAGGTQ